MSSSIETTGASSQIKTEIETLVLKPPSDSRSLVLWNKARVYIMQRAACKSHHAACGMPCLPRSMQRPTCIAPCSHCSAPRRMRKHANAHGTRGSLAENHFGWDWLLRPIEAAGLGCLLRRYRVACCKSPLYAARGALYGMQLLRRDIETKRLLRNTEQLELALDDQQLVHAALRQQVSPPPHSAPGKASESNTAGTRQQSSCRRFAAYSARAIARLVRCKRFTWASASRMLRRSPRGQRQRH